MGNNTNKSTVVIKQKIVREQNKQKIEIKEKRKEGGLCRSCFGNKKTVKITQKSVIHPEPRASYIHDTRKSSILVKSQPHVQVDDTLFANRDKKLLDIKMRRAEPYEILKDSDYFDSEPNDKSVLDNLKKVYDTCEIANYQTPETEKLQTVLVKTYLFDRNLTKLQA